jgi:hypothetical protein
LDPSNWILGLGHRFLCPQRSLLDPQLIFPLALPPSVRRSKLEPVAYRYVQATRLLLVASYVAKVAVILLYVRGVVTKAKAVGMGADGPCDACQVTWCCIHVSCTSRAGKRNSEVVHGCHTPSPCNPHPIPARTRAIKVQRADTTSRTKFEIGMNPPALHIFI